MGKSTLSQGYFKTIKISHFNTCRCFPGFRGGDKSTTADSSGSLSRGTGGGHSRTYSDGSADSGSAAPSCHPTPPKGPRVVLGRETTPTEQPQKIPQDVWDKFDGKSREVR